MSFSDAWSTVSEGIVYEPHHQMAQLCQILALTDSQEYQAVT